MLISCTKFISSTNRSEDWAEEVVLDRSAVMEQADGDLTKAVDLVRREIAHTYGSLSNSRTLLTVCFIAKNDTEAAIVVRGAHVLFDAPGLTSCMDRIVASIARQLGTQLEDDSAVQWGEEIPRLRGPGVEYMLRHSRPEKKEYNDMVVERALEAMKNLTVSERPTQIDLAHLPSRPRPQLASTLRSRPGRRVPRPLSCDP